jgi:hypothetical protein
MQSVKRSIKSSQPKVRELTFKVDGVGVAVSELDASQVGSLIHVGAGIMTIIFSNPLQSATMKWLVKGFVPTTAGIIAQVTATADDRVTIKTTLAATGVATDAVYYLNVVGTDSTILY